MIDGFDQAQHAYENAEPHGRPALWGEFEIEYLVSLSGSVDAGGRVRLTHVNSRKLNDKAAEALLSALNEQALEEAAQEALAEEQEPDR